MAEVLSQAQIDALLGNLQSGAVDIKQIERDPVAKVKEYDFRSPKRFTREQIKLLTSIYDSFARLLTLRLTSILRMPCEIEILQVEEQRYYEFNNALEDSVLIGVMELDESADDGEEQSVLMEINRSLSSAIIDRMVGGSGDTPDITRDYTDIELSLFEYIFKHVTQVSKSAWENHYNFVSSLKMIETNSRLIQNIPYEETVVIVVLEASFKKKKGIINICLPAPLLDRIFRSLGTRNAKIARKGNPEVEALRKDTIMGNLNDSELIIHAMLGRTEITLHELFTLQRGDVIPLRTPVDSNGITLEIEGDPWFGGTIGAKNKKYAVKIAENIKFKIKE